jgi:hypothetical protein
MRTRLSALCAMLVLAEREALAEGRAVTWLWD